MTKVTIGCKRHGTDIAFSKILESEDVSVFLRVGIAYYEEDSMFFAFFAN